MGKTPNSARKNEEKRANSAQILGVEEGQGEGSTSLLPLDAGGSPKGSALRRSAPELGSGGGGDDKI